MLEEYEKNIDINGNQVFVMEPYNSQYKLSKMSTFLGNKTLIPELNKRFIPFAEQYNEDMKKPIETTVIDGTYQSIDS
jgi:hypothetical protein